MSKLLTNSARIANLFLLSAPLFLTACAFGPWQREFWHPPAATGVAPIASGPTYPIPRASGEGDIKWSKLTSVPPRPPVPLTGSQIDAELQELEADHAAAQAASALVAAQQPEAEKGKGSEKPTIPAAPPASPPPVEFPSPTEEPYP